MNFDYSLHKIKTIIEKRKKKMLFKQLNNIVENSC